jgi:putative Mg2+ transporter-C (MgtC) family protein
MNIPPLTVDLMTRLLLASFLGGLIGLEREVHGRPAGFRTHLLVSLGSCLFVITSIGFYRLYGNPGPGPVGVDPGRVAAQVVTGIGFLGAGAIIREGNSVRGLTTAACLWVAAAIGLACGIRMFDISCAVTVIALLSLLLLKKVETTFSRDTYTLLTVRIADGKGQRGLIDDALRACAVEIVSEGAEICVTRGIETFDFEVKLTQRSQTSELLSRIAEIPGVSRLRLGRSHKGAFSRRAAADQK